MGTYYPRADRRLSCWLLQQGYALGTINVKLSTVKQYAGLAFQAGAIDPTQHALIAMN